MDAFSRQNFCAEAFAKKFGANALAQIDFQMVGPTMGS